MYLENFIKRVEADKVKFRNCLYKRKGGGGNQPKK